MILASGMKDWSVTEWVAFFAAVGGFVTVTLAPFLWTLFGKISDLAKQISEAKSVAHGADTKAAIADTKANAANQGVAANAISINDINRNMPSPTVVSIEAVTAAMQSQVPEPPKGPTP